MSGTNPYKSIGFWAREATSGLGRVSGMPGSWVYPGLGHTRVPGIPGTRVCSESYKLIGFGDIHGPKPYKLIGFGDIHVLLPFLS